MTIVSRMAVATVAVVAFAVMASTAYGLGAGGLKANYGGGGAELSGDGHHLAFSSNSTNLTPESYGGASPYLRNLDSGLVGIVTSLGSTEYSLSEDARFVAFSLLGGSANVYVRDRQEGTTVLASRADGPNGVAADQEYGFMRPSISSNGRFVAFQTKSPLDPADTDTDPYLRVDIYVRDLVTDSTTLVSRASGATGVKGNRPSEGPSISGDGRYVAFETEASNLTVDDTDPTRDIYVRDLVANTTALVTDPEVTGFDGNSFHPDITPDGRFVAFDSMATNLAPGEDDGGIADIYVRDLQTNTTVLASPGTGYEPADYPTLSADGNRVAFQTDAPLVPEDTDGRFPYTDIYLRDIQAGTTSLVSRASGVEGTDAWGSYPAISGDGRYVAFDTNAHLAVDDNDESSDVYVRDTQDHITSLESRATPGYLRYVRPKGATPMRLSLVPAYEACTAPNRTHGPPLAFPACQPPQPESPNLVVSQGETRLRSVGFLLLQVRAGDPWTPTVDEADVNIRFGLTNVMNAADFSDYAGELRGMVQMRITDRRNGSATTEEATVSDIPFEFVVPCVATQSTLDGADCALTTTADAVVPGFASEGSRAVHGLGQVQVFDGGPDGDVDTRAGDSLFAVQGIFVP